MRRLSEQRAQIVVCVMACLPVAGCGNDPKKATKENFKRVVAQALAAAPQDASWKVCCDEKAVRAISGCDPASVEVERFSEPASVMGATISEAHCTFKCDPKSFLATSQPRGSDALTVEGKAELHLYNDGWQLSLLDCAFRQNNKQVYWCQISNRKLSGD